MIYVTEEFYFFIFFLEDQCTIRETVEFPAITLRRDRDIKPRQLPTSSPLENLN